MTRRRWFILAGVLAPVAAAVILFFTFFSTSSLKKLTLSTDTRSTVGATGALAGTWQVASGSTAGYRVRERLAVLNAPSDAVGRTSAITGGFQLADGGDTLTVSNASFTVDVTQLSSDRGQRDNAIRHRGLETSTYPTATFKLANP